MLIVIDRELTRLEEHIKTVEPGSDEYDRTLRQIQDFLHLQNQLLQSYERVDESRLDKILKNPAFVGGVFSLLATGWVLHHERLDVITSRAFGWIRFK